MVRNADGNMPLKLYAGIIPSDGIIEFDDKAYSCAEFATAIKDTTNLSLFSTLDVEPDYTATFYTGCWDKMDANLDVYEEGTSKSF
jgi:hypothetical protein